MKTKIKEVYEIIFCKIRQQEKQKKSVTIFFYRLISKICGYNRIKRINRWEDINLF